MKKSPQHLRGLYLLQAKAFALDQTRWLLAGRRPAPGGLCLTSQLEWAELKAGWPPCGPAHRPPVHIGILASSCLLLGARPAGGAGATEP